MTLKQFRHQLKSNSEHIACLKSDIMVRKRREKREIERIRLGKWSDRQGKLYRDHIENERNSFKLEG